MPERKLASDEKEGAADAARVGDGGAVVENVEPGAEGMGAGLDGEVVDDFGEVVEAAGG